MAPHIVLHELEWPHQSVCLRTGDEAHKTPEFLALNPLGKLPALVIQQANADSVVLTEVSAILPFLALNRPESSLNLWPSDGIEQAHAMQWIAVIASEVHPAYAMHIRPDRVFPSSNKGCRCTRSGTFHRIDEPLESSLQRAIRLGRNLHRR